MLEGRGCRRRVEVARRVKEKKRERRRASARSRASCAAETGPVASWFVSDGAGGGMLILTSPSSSYLWGVRRRWQVLTSSAGGSPAAYSSAPERRLTLLPSTLRTTRQPPVLTSITRPSRPDASSWTQRPKHGSFASMEWGVGGRRGIVSLYMGMR